jgi:uncharacterized protein (TIGR02270 family)
VGRSISIRHGGNHGDPLRLDPASTLIIRDVVEQHADEAAFLWSLRDVATDEPHYALRHLAALEERIEAHLDGLRAAGEAAHAIAWAKLDQYGAPGELFVVATLALESRDPVRLERAVQFAESAQMSRQGLFGALGWVSRDALRGQVVAWLDDTSSFRRLVGVVACSLHRADLSSRMQQLLADDPSVRARALRLVGELGSMGVREQVRVALNDDDEACRFWAAWSAGLLGDRSAAIPVLQDYAAGGSVCKWRALDLVVRLMDHGSAISWIRHLGRDSGHGRLVVMGTGILGDPVAVPWLIHKMSDPALARVAGESVSMITGWDLSELGLDGNAPEGFAAGPTDDPADNSIAIDLDENLSWPDPLKIQARWEKESVRFASGIRHLRGLPCTRESCNDILRDGYQRQRRAAAYRLALIDAGRPLWNWRARSGVQTTSLRLQV